MSKKDKLLSDEELREESELFLCKAYNQRDHGDLSENLIDNIAAFINTQKRLYAESVVGEDELNTYEPYGDMYATITDRNQLRAEQRANLLKALGNIEQDIDEEPCDYCKQKGREYTPECELNK